VSLNVGLDAVMRKFPSFPLRELNPSRPARSLVTIQIKLSRIENDKNENKRKERKLIMCNT
jgi:hypothetical protein